MIIGLSEIRSQRNRIREFRTCLQPLVCGQRVIRFTSGFNVFKLFLSERNQDYRIGLVLQLAQRCGEQLFEHINGSTLTIGRKGRHSVGEAAQTSSHLDAGSLVVKFLKDRAYPFPGGCEKVSHLVA